MCKCNKVYTGLVVLDASIDHIEPVTPSGYMARTIEQEYLVTLHSTLPFELSSLRKVLAY